jgi:hypothetical protein
MKPPARVMSVCTGGQARQSSTGRGYRQSDHELYRLAEDIQGVPGLTLPYEGRYGVCDRQECCESRARARAT